LPGLEIVVPLADVVHALDWPLSKSDKIDPPRVVVGEMKERK
jgi:hypothetical protein